MNDSKSSAKIAEARVHFIGIGGIGMCGLAELLAHMGAKVSGSDLHANTQTTRLKSLGIDVRIGHQAENILDAQVVVYSSAIKKDNVEYSEARRRKIPLIPRAEALAELMRLKRGLAVAGSHGKTTTTSMLASIFLSAQREPTVVIGGRLEAIQSTAKIGNGEWLIAESDESDGSFLRLAPEIAIITNIDNDHLDHYGTIESLKKAYHDFALLIPFYGKLVVCGDDPLCREVFGDFPKPLATYGFDHANDFYLEGENGSYQIFNDGAALGEMKLMVPGRHNALNGLAAVVASLEAGLKIDEILIGLATYTGVDRRFQYKGRYQDALIYDDYGHHPTEIAAVLQAFREKFPKSCIKVVFQPHRYSRTLLCWSQFLEAFELADEVYICDIYPAGESAIPGITGERLAKEIKKPLANYLSSGSDRSEFFAQRLKAGDVFVTLGAGDIWKTGQSLVDRGR